MLILIILLSALQIYQVNLQSPVTWVPSQHFLTGILHIILGAVTAILNGTAFQTETVTYPRNFYYSQVVLGLADLNIKVSDSLLLKVAVQSTTDIGFDMSLKTTNGSQFTLVKISYFTSNPSITAPVSYNVVQIEQLIEGPFSESDPFNFTQATGLELNLNNKNSMIAFLYGMQAQSQQNCYEINLIFQLLNQNQYQLGVSSSCNMNLTYVAISRIIFDITAIEQQGFSYFQHGEIQSSNGNTSSLSLNLNPFFDTNFMFGMKSFKISNISNFHFSSNLGGSTTVNTSMNYDVLNFMYWSLKYRDCESYSFYRHFDQLCYNLCPDQTYLSNSTKQCLECTYTCATCSDFDICTSCSSEANRQQNGSACSPLIGYFDNGTSQAVLCSDSIQNCTECLDSVNCTMCQDKHFLSISKQCLICSSDIPNCYECQIVNGINLCSQCEQYFVIDSNNLTCSEPICAQQACIWCPTNDSICQVCTTGYNLVSEQCQPICGDGLELDVEQCDDNNTVDGDGCNADCTIGNNNNCSSLTPFISPLNSSCTNDCTLGYFQDFDPFECLICHYTCLSCTDSITCDSCQPSDHRQLIGEQCVPVFGYFHNDTKQSALCQGPCQSCTSISQCLTCLQGYYILLSDCLPCSTITTNCSQCLTTSGVCTKCDKGFLYNQTTFICDEIPCHDPYCLGCLINDAICEICQIGFVLKDGKCFEICGDNKKIGKEECDDGNLNQNDGCSKICLVENDFICQSENVTSTVNPQGSVCYFIGNISITQIYIDKLTGQNAIQIKLQLKPKDLSVWNNIDFMDLIKVDSQISIKSYLVNRNQDGILNIEIKYAQSIQNKNIVVKINPLATNQTSLSRLDYFQYKLPIVPTNNKAAHFYSSNVYFFQEILQKSALAISFLALFVLLASAIVGGKMIGIQMMAVLQVSFFSLVTMRQLNPCFSALSSLRFVSGYNIVLSDQSAHLKDTFTPLSPKGIFLFSNFTLNLNFTLLLVILPLIVALIAFILSQSIFKKNMLVTNIAMKSVGQYTLMSLLFIGYLMSASFAIEILYGQKKFEVFLNLISIIELSVLLALYGFYFVFMVFKPCFFGEFTECFRKAKSSSKYYNLVLIERIIVGSLLIILLSLNLQAAVQISIFAVLIIYIALVGPYSQKFNNYRQIGNFLITIIILSVYLNWNLTDTNTRNSMQIYFYLPFVICGLLFLCILINSISIVYTLILKHRKNSLLKNQLQQLASLQTEGRLMNLSNISSPLTPMALNSQSINPSSARNRLKLHEVRSQIKLDSCEKSSSLCPYIEPHLANNDQFFQQQYGAI